MRVTILIEEPEYGKFSDLKLCFIKDSVEKQVSLSLFQYEKVYDFKTDFSSVKFDFFLISAIVYGVDNLLSREIYSNDGWTRDLEVELPVRNLDAWLGKEFVLKEMLDFLTGDNWTLSFTQIELDNFYYSRPLSRRRKAVPVYEIDKIKSVSLFSGGLDSLIGVIDELEKLVSTEKILLVSHFDNKSPGPNGDQIRLLTYLKTKYPNKIYWIQSKLALARKDQNNTKLKIENNYRSRSLFFIGLGCYLSPTEELIIPENGTISINYPLTPSRVSSLSTRTTHPFVLNKVNELFAALGLSTTVYNPYTFKTKGEMFLNCSNQNVLKQIYHESVSCGKRGRRQFHFDNPNEKHHCGRCMPCIYRRAALNKVDLDSELHYGNFITKVNSLGQNDLPALFSFLKRNISIEMMKRDLIVNGNIDFDKLDDYANMVLRSKEEVKTLFQDKGSVFVKSELRIR